MTQLETQLPLSQFKEVAAACIADVDARCTILAEFNQGNGSINLDMMDEEYDTLNIIFNNNKKKFGESFDFIYSFIDTSTSRMVAEEMWADGLFH